MLAKPDHGTPFAFLTRNCTCSRLAFDCSTTRRNEAVRLADRECRSRVRTYCSLAVVYDRRDELAILHDVSRLSPTAESHDVVAAGNAEFQPCKRWVPSIDVALVRTAHRPFLL